MTLFRNSIQDGMKFGYQYQRYHLMMFLESLYKLRICQSDQLKTVLELYEMEIDKKISMPKEE